MLVLKLDLVSDISFGQNLLQDIGINCTQVQESITVRDVFYSTSLNCIHSHLYFLVS